MELKTKRKGTDDKKGQSWQPTSVKMIWYVILFFMATVLFGISRQEYSGTEKESIGFTANTWLSGSFQYAYEQILLERNLAGMLKKIKNKYEYSFFGKINLEGFYEGKQGYIFQEATTKNYFGDDYKGVDSIKEEVRKAKLVADSLEAYGIKLLLIFAPCKESVYPEFLPESVLRTKKKLRNYETYVAECSRQSVGFLDFVQLFGDLKKKAKAPLFPKSGSHWSYFAECFVVDTTIKRMEHLLNTDLPNIICDHFALYPTARFRDADIFLKSGLDLPITEQLAYAENIGYTSTATERPQEILAVGDSYFRGFFYLSAMQTAFGNSVQWYYNNSIIPESPANKEVWELDLKSEILKHKAIVILCNETNLTSLGNGFIDNAYRMFNDPQTYYHDKKESDLLNKYRKMIRKDEELLTMLTREMHQRGISLDSIITLTALKIKSEEEAE